MQTLSDRQLAEVTQIIMDEHLALVASIVGFDMIPPDDLKRLRRKGLLPKSSLNLPEQAYTFGVLAQGLEDPVLSSLTWQEFLTRVAKNPIPLTYEERTAVKAVQRNIANRLKGLGNTFDLKTHSVLIEADHAQRRRLESRVKHALAAGIAKRQTTKQIAGELARLTKDMQRDWDRVVMTEVHNAFIEGRTAQIQKRNKGNDPLVFKRPRPDACPKCNEHYLEADGVTPRVFKLSELVANGTTNENRKLGLWKPTLGCLHPYCFPAGVRVLTARGQVPIEEVTTTDLVMTHTGVWRRVTQLHRNHHAGWLTSVNGTYATALHPALTQRGWVPAEALQGGDYVIDASREVTLVEAQHGEAQAAELLRLGRILHTLSGAIVPVAAVHLDGESEMAVPEVEVVLAHGHMRGEGQLCEHRRETALQARQSAGLLLGLGDLHTVLKGLFGAAHRGMRSLSELAALIGRELLVPDELAFAAAPGLDAVFGHVPHDGGATHPEQPGHLQHGTHLNVVQPVQALFGQHTVTVPYNGSKRKWHNGVVYNLSVWGDESYLADGKVVHNCQCTLHELPPGFAFDATGRMTYAGVGT